MVERPAEPHLSIFASILYDHSPTEQWPELIARAHRLGVAAIMLRPVWAWHTSPTGSVDLHGQSAPNRDLISLLRLCHTVGLMVVLDLGGLDTPPLPLLRSHAAIALAEADGVPRVPPLHPTLIADMRQWITHLSAACLPFQHPAGPIIALLTANLSAPSLSLLDDWLRNDGWQIACLRAAAPIDLAAGWPFQQHALYAGDLSRLFRTDGSATLRLWDIKPFAALVRSRVIDVSGAQPPAGPQGIRDAWADGPDMDIQVRHSEQHTFLSLHNRRAEPYSGMLTYRNREGELLHLHANLGPQRHGVVLLHGEEIAGVASTGDASEGVWLVRAMRSSIVFNGGSGGVIPSGRGVLLMAAQSGRFQLRRMQGWAEMQAYRLTMHGELLSCPCQIEAQHLTVPYIVEDQHGQTDRYMILLPSDPLADDVEAHLRMLLRMRAAEVQSLAALCQNEAHQQLMDAAALLEATALGQFDLTDYRTSWATNQHLMSEHYQRFSHEQAQLEFQRQLRGPEPASEEERWRAQLLTRLQRLTN